MFIYLIEADNKKYVGFDSKPSHKSYRWKAHKKLAMSGCQSKVHRAMRKVGVDNCTYKIIEDNIKSISDLAVKEIEYIRKYDSFRNGLNSTMGGDGYGSSDLANMSEDEITKIKNALSDTMKLYNEEIKWAGTTPEQRKQMTAHLHNEEIYKKRAETLKETYKNNPELKKMRGDARKKWVQDNPDEFKRLQKKASLAGAAKVSKPVKVQFEDGRIEIFSSKRDYTKQHGYDIDRIIQRTKNGSSHKGKKAWLQ